MNWLYKEEETPAFSTSRGEAAFDVKGVDTMNINVRCPHCYSDTACQTHSLGMADKDLYACHCLGCDKDFEIEVNSRQIVGTELTKSVQYA